MLDNYAVGSNLHILSILAVPGFNSFAVVASFSLREFFLYYIISVCLYVCQFSGCLCCNFAISLLFVNV